MSALRYDARDAVFAALGAAFAEPNSVMNFAGIRNANESGTDGQ